MALALTDTHEYPVEPLAKGARQERKHEDEKQLQVRDKATPVTEKKY